MATKSLTSMLVGAVSMRSSASVTQELIAECG